MCSWEGGYWLLRQGILRELGLGGPWRDDYGSRNSVCLCLVDQPQRNWESTENHKRIFWEQADSKAIHLQAEMIDPAGAVPSQG